MGSLAGMVETLNQERGMRFYLAQQNAESRSRPVGYLGQRRSLLPQRVCVLDSCCMVSHDTVFPSGVRRITVILDAKIPIPFYDLVFNVASVSEMILPLGEP